MNLLKLIPSPVYRASLALLGLTLASCSMPAKEAWRIIRKDGLLSYLNAELQHQGKPSTTTPRRSSYLSNNPWQPKKRPTAAPSPAVAEPKYNAPLAKETPPAAKPPVVNNESAGIPKQSTQKKPSTAPASKPTAEAKKTPAAPAQRKVQPAPAAKKETASSPPIKAPVPSLQLPYGESIPNRPGMVHSPFAAQHQIVDVAGLSPGQEVKCPYTGKLFRVPGPEQAAEPKLKDLPSPPPAAAKQPEKKSSAPPAPSSSN